VEKIFKLGLAAFAFSRYSNTYFIMDYLATSEPNYFAQLSNGVHAKYSRVFLRLREARADGADAGYFAGNLVNLLEIPVENQTQSARMRKRYDEGELFAYWTIPATLRAKLR